MTWQATDEIVAVPAVVENEISNQYVVPGVRPVIIPEVTIAVAAVAVVSTCWTDNPKLLPVAATPLAGPAPVPNFPSIVNVATEPEEALPEISARALEE
jgi:hypothetical protein